MQRTLTPKLALFAALLSSTAAFAQEDRTVSIVLNEELDVVERAACPMPTRATASARPNTCARKAATR